METNQKAIIVFIIFFILTNIIYAITATFPGNPLAFVVLELVLAITAVILLKIYYHAIF